MQVLRKTYPRYLGMSLQGINPIIFQIAPIPHRPMKDFEYIRKEHPVA